MKTQKITLICCIIIGFLGFFGLLGFFGFFGFLRLIYLYFIRNQREKIKENMIDLGLPETSHTVNLPINTTYECENKCMPPSRCSITGEQCTSDIDCCGCIPTPNTEKNIEGFTSDQLNSAYGADAQNKVTDFDLFTPEEELFSKPPQYFLGIDTWSKSFYEGAQLFNDAHDPNIQKARYPKNNPKFQLKYPNRATLSGLFVENGPLTVADI